MKERILKIVKCIFKDYDYREINNLVFYNAIPNANPNQKDREELIRILNASRNPFVVNNSLKSRNNSNSSENINNEKKYIKAVTNKSIFYFENIPNDASFFLVSFENSKKSCMRFCDIEKEKLINNIDIKEIALKNTEWGNFCFDVRSIENNNKKRIYSIILFSKEDIGFSDLFSIIKYNQLYKPRESFIKKNLLAFSIGNNNDLQYYIDSMFEGNQIKAIPLFKFNFYKVENSTNIVNLESYHTETNSNEKLSDCIANKSFNNIPFNFCSSNVNYITQEIQQQQQLQQQLQQQQFQQQQLQQQLQQQQLYQYLQLLQIMQLQLQLQKFRK
ncbi:hypothetical protein BCR36DRAFT_457583 [Piromyces finnis]|uniref:Uncharacterized protein n=1 Tax=Piromyces finnis TaxID=1754191 RepID=A0A1Y1VL68_9FUNG|nr:hypothetical protein BCR36DRAFT_457583 [Piromyces finnis]|eukprot:ORX58646.1 hypothetical protein BCR36DRAFT_457583 [Piromyces finnis]